MNKLIYYLSFLLCFILGCSKETSTHVNQNNYKLNKISSFSIPLDSVSSIRPLYMSEFSLNGKPHLGIVQQGNFLHFYSLENGQLIHHFNYPNEGPNIINLKAFKFISPDSIFLFGKGGQALHLYDIEQNLVEKYILQEEVSKRKFFRMGEILIHNGAKPLLFEGQFLVSCMCTSGGGSFLMGKEVFKYASLEVMVKFITNSYKELNIKYPKELRNANEMHPLLYCRTLDIEGKNILFSFSSLHDIYKYDLTTNKMQQIDGKSRFIEGKIPPEKEGLSSKEIERHNAETPRYLNLIYDPFRELYYRIVALKVPEKFMTAPNLSIDLKEFSIIIFDKDLNIVGEKKLPTKKYWPVDSFVGPKGLYISTANYFNPDLGERQLNFDIFEADKLQLNTGKEY